MSVGQLWFFLLLCFICYSFASTSSLTHTCECFGTKFFDFNFCLLLRNSKRIPFFSLIQIFKVLDENLYSYLYIDFFHLYRQWQIKSNFKFWYLRCEMWVFFFSCFSLFECDFCCCLSTHFFFEWNIVWQRKTLLKAISVT